MPRLIRRRPLLVRIKDYLHPGDWLLWISEELETKDWDNKQLGNTSALLFHILLLFAKINVGTSQGSPDDVFGDENPSFRWVGWLASLTVYLLSTVCLTNAVYTLFRKRQYRLFESCIDVPPQTSSARRVRVNSSPMSSSPLRVLHNILHDASAEARAHPDPTRDVWEISVWDPLPFCLRLFCLFSPGHVLVYWLFLPTGHYDPRPSITVLKTIILQALISVQLLILQANFSQQSKDSSIIHQEVMSEYDIKFVHPRMYPTVRDVSTQYDDEGSRVQSGRKNCVVTFKPTVILKRAFQTRPNPNYAKYYDPENLGNDSLKSDLTPISRNSQSPTPFFGLTSRNNSKQSQLRCSLVNLSTLSTGANIGTGGSLGIYSHSNSPLKKAASLHDMKNRAYETPRNSFDMAHREIKGQYERSIGSAARTRDSKSSYDVNMNLDEQMHPRSSNSKFKTDDNIERPIKKERTNFY